MGTVISGAGGKAANARAAATRTKGSLSFSRATSTLGRLAAEFLVFRMNPGQGPKARRAQHFVARSWHWRGPSPRHPWESAPVRRARTWPPCAACSSPSRAAICGTAGTAASPNAPSVSTASRRISGFLSFSFSVIAGNRVLGRGANVAKDDQRPEGDLIVLQGFDQTGHGLDAAFRDGGENPHADGRIGILQQLDADRDHDLRAGVNGPDGPQGSAANRCVRVFQQFGQSRHGILGRGADRTQGQRRVGADLGRLVFEQGFDRLARPRPPFRRGRPTRRALSPCRPRCPPSSLWPAESAATGVSSA